MGIKKLIILFQVIFVVIFSGVFYTLLNDYEMEEAKSRVRYTQNLNKALAAFNNDFQKSAVAKLQKKGVLQKDFFNVDLMSASFMTRQVHDEYLKVVAEREEEAYFIAKFASLQPLNPINRANDYEIKLLEMIQNSAEDALELTDTLEGKKTFVYAQAIRMQPKCLTCHGDPKDAPKELVDRYGTKSGFNRKEGDIHALLTVYTPLDANAERKNIFFATVIGFVIAVLIVIYFILSYYIRSLKQKDELLIESSQYATLGEIGKTIVGQWREPLSQISARVDTMVMDHEFGDVDIKRHLELLQKTQEALEKFSGSIENFKMLYNPDSQPTLLLPSLILDDVIGMLHKESVLNDIAYAKMYDTDKRFLLSENDFYIVSIQMLQTIIKLSKTYESRGMTVTIKVYEREGGLHIMISTNVLTDKHLVKEVTRELQKELAVVQLLTKEKLRGTFTLSVESDSIAMGIVIPQ